MEEEVIEEVVETPTEPEVVEEPVAEPEQPIEPMRIYTNGNWAKLEDFMPHNMTVGKTYHIKVAGHCQFMISAEQPTMGITTNEITYKKDENNHLWIKTGE